MDLGRAALVVGLPAPWAAEQHAGAEIRSRRLARVLPDQVFHSGRLSGRDARARPLTDPEWQQLNYRAFVTRGEWYVEENFDAFAGEWRQGDLRLGISEHKLMERLAEYKQDSFGVLNGRLVAWITTNSGPIWRAPTR